MDKKKMPTAFHGVKGLKFAKKGAETYETPIVIEFAKSLSYQKQRNDSQIIYANNVQIDEIPNGGYAEGSIGVTGTSVPLETLLGAIAETDIGIVEMMEDSLVRGAIGYIVTVRDPDTKKPADVKVWILNATVNTTGQETNQTDEDTITIGEKTYDYRAYGEQVKINDEEKTIIRIKSYPGDKNYETFLNAVPEFGTLTVTTSTLSAPAQTQVQTGSTTRDK